MRTTAAVQQYSFVQKCSSIDLMFFVLTIVTVFWVVSVLTIAALGLDSVLVYVVKKRRFYVTFLYKRKGKFVVIILLML